MSFNKLRQLAKERFPSYKQSKYYYCYKEFKHQIELFNYKPENGFVLLLIEKNGVFGINYVEANVCYFNISLINESPKSKLLIDYCSIAHGIDLLKVA